MKICIMTLVSSINIKEQCYPHSLSNLIESVKRRSFQRQVRSDRRRNRVDDEGERMPTVWSAEDIIPFGG